MGVGVCFKPGCHLRNSVRNSLHKWIILIMQNYVSVALMTELTHNYAVNYAVSTANGNPAKDEISVNVILFMAFQDFLTTWRALYR